MNDNRKPDRRKFQVLATRMTDERKAELQATNEINRYRLIRHCTCLHRDKDGEMAFEVPSQNSPKSKITGAALYQCKTCGKHIDLSSLPDKDINMAIDTLDRLCDVVKMRSNINSEKDNELLESLASFQYMLNYLIPDAAKSIRGGQKKKKNENESFISYGRSK